MHYLGSFVLQDCFSLVFTFPSTPVITVLCIYCSSVPAVSPCPSTVLCTNCQPVPQYLLSSVSTVPLYQLLVPVHLCLLFLCSTFSAPLFLSFSKPIVPLCTYCSFVPLLFCVYCSPVPTAPLSRFSPVPQFL